MSGTGNFLDIIAHPTVVNPVAAFEQAGRAANATWDARKSQAQQLQGQAAIDAIDRSTGQMDQTRYGAAMRGYGPGAALGAQESMQKAQTLSTNQLNFNDAQQTQLAKHFGGMITQPDALQTPDGYRAALLEARSDGTLDDSHLKGAMAALDALGPNPSPTQLRTLGSRFLITGLSTADIARNALPQTVISHTNQGDIPTVVAPAPVGLPPTGGQYQTTGGTQQGVAPEAGYVADTRPGALPGSFTKVIPPGGGGTQPTPQALPLPPTPPAQSPFVNPNAPLGTPPGRAWAPPPKGSPLLSPNAPPPAPNAATQPPAPPAATTPGATGTPPAATPAAPPVTYTQPPQGQPEEVAASVLHLSDARGRANNYQQTIQPIEGALTALAGADTGKASETLNNLRGWIQDVTPGFLQRMMPTSLTDPEQRKKFEETNKYLTQMAINAPGGARSNEGAAAAGAATPSVHISNAAATEVARAILAQRRMEQVGTMLFNQSGQLGANYDRFMNDWATTVDPRAMVADKMSASERAAMVKSMGGTTSPEYQQFRKSYEDAVAAKVIRHGTPAAAATPTGPASNLALAARAPANALAAYA